MSSTRVKRREAAECLVARYRHEPWFVSSYWSAGEPFVQLKVREECPFRKHRQVNSVDVEVVVMVVARRPVLVPQASRVHELRKRTRNVVRLEAKPRIGDVAAVVRRIKAERRKKTA